MLDNYYLLKDALLTVSFMICTPRKMLLCSSS